LRKIQLLAALLVGVVCALATTPKAAPKSTKKTPVKKSTASKSAAKKTTASKKTAGKKTTASQKTAASWRSAQRAPTPERYKEIQQALASKGYLEPNASSGVWDASSVTAMKKFQQEQNLEPSGKIDSLSLIALGLGPKHDQPSTPQP
jgi:Putative peptidoglycan binding domain